MACRTRRRHSGLMKTTGPFTSLCSTVNICAPPSPTSFIALRSAVIPSLLTLPATQCHHVRGLAESGGFAKPAARASGVPPAFSTGAAQSQLATDNRATPAEAQRMKAGAVRAGDFIPNCYTRPLCCPIPKIAVTGPRVSEPDPPTHLDAASRAGPDPS